MMRLFIEPTDVWTFGDGRPFEAGEDHRRLSLFPPTAHTLQGAIRSRILSDAGVSFDAYRRRDPSCSAIAEQIGWPGEGYGALSLRGPFVASMSGSQVTVYHPLPADVLESKSTDKCHVLAPLADSPFVSNAPDGVCPLWLRDANVKGTGGWIADQTLDRYLNEEALDRQDIVRDGALFVKESRFGVMINSTVKRPEEGHLYQMEFIRVRDGVGVIVDVEGVPACPSSGMLQLGGDARAARLTAVPTPPARAFPSPLPLRFKVVLLSPAYFTSGWQPTAWSTWFQGEGVRLVAAAVRRPTLIGGFDLAKWKDKSANPQRPLRRHVPAGSVYYFASDEPATYTGKPVTEDGAAIGFGQITIGGWNYV